jgi:hypothetical protein
MAHQMGDKMRFIPLGFGRNREFRSSEEERAISEEDSKPLSLTPEEKQILRQAWKALRQQKPDLYCVLAARRKEHQLRRGSTHYDHAVSRGFYKRIAKRLGITPQTVCYRLKAAMEWLGDWLRIYAESKEA